MRRDLGVGLIVAGIVLVVAIAFFYVVLPNLPESTTSLRLGDGVFKAQIAANDTDRIKGLSGVTELASDKALLLAFPNTDTWKIWMKDMKIPIDIVWLNQDKKVIYIVKKASPDDPTEFEPKTPALYVVELPAGTVDSKAITTDSTAVFQINSEDVK